ncbi:MAG TPA: IPT/TIG domain-containing protein [Acidimicrobiales bacterium]|nr:IPT/TIG domain-containing protein [Acidimicrobiales bacterium]
MPRHGWRAASVLVALCLIAAACSSAKAQGTLGATLAAENGTVTLVKVVYPAPVGADSPAFPPLGHQLAAVVLTVHSPTSAAAKFSDIYAKSQLFDSRGAIHLAKSTAKYKISECLTYPTFGTVPAGTSTTGCEVFVLSAAATPTALQISGKAKGRWTIAAADIQAGTTGSPGAPAPSTGVTTPTTVAPGSSPSTTAVPPTTTTSFGPVATVPTTTTAALASAPASHRSHHHGSALRIKIDRINPSSGFAGLKVTIFGRGLGRTTQVTFSGVPALIRKISPAKLVVTVPVGATSGPVIVATALASVEGPKDFQVY